MQAEIVVNGRFLARRVTGVERYAGEILKRLPGRVRVIQPGRPSRGSAGHVWEQLVLPARLPANAILWSPANSGPLRVASQVLSIHDLAPLEHPEWYRPAFSWWYRFFLPPLAHRVRRIITGSECVRQKLISRFSIPPNRVIRVPEGVDRERFRPAHGADRGEYILYTGSLEPRKNLPRLLAAWAQIKSRFRGVTLVVAGESRPVFRSVDLPAGMEQVRFLGYAPELELPGWYANALLFVFPSLDEGFGLPVLEAMASGVPVVTSHAGALPEVAGEAAILCDPYQVGSIAGALEQGLSSPELRQALRQKGLEQSSQFDWRISAEQVWKVLQDAYEG